MKLHMEKEELTKQLGERLKKERISLGLTQKEFGRLTGFTQKYVSELENGKKTPTLASITHICKALNIDINYLVYGTLSPRYTLIGDSEKCQEIKHLLSQCNDVQYDLCIKMIRNIVCSCLFNQNKKEEVEDLEEEENS